MHGNNNILNGPKNLLLKSKSFHSQQTLRFTCCFFGLKHFCAKAKAVTVTTTGHRAPHRRWPLAHCWGHRQLLRHTQHHDVATARRQAWISSILLNFQWAVTLTVDSTGGTGPWMLTEVFVKRGSFQGHFMAAAVAFPSVTNPCSLHRKLWK